MSPTIEVLLERLESDALLRSEVIPWSSPIPSFGDHARSLLATLGLNPSNREFMDVAGKELDGAQRRFHTLASLGLKRWSDASAREQAMILESCRTYFERNPYDGWFKRLDLVLSGTGTSYYGSTSTACHLDLIPYATSSKWTSLRSQQRALLLRIASDTLAMLLRESSVRVLVLNGMSVVGNFQNATGVKLRTRTMPAWTLPRRARQGVAGISFKGSVTHVAGIDLGREVLVLGYNHNIQSSFGVTLDVVHAIRGWVACAAARALS